MPQLLKENEVSYYLGEKHIYPKGSGDGGSAIIPIIEQTASTVAIDPGCLNLWGEMASLNITLNAPADPEILNEYMIQFTSGATATQFSLPQGVEWGTQDPEQPNPLVVKANAIYQISIVNNIGLWAAISNS